MLRNWILMSSNRQTSFHSVSFGLESFVLFCWFLQQDFDPVVCWCDWYDVAFCTSGVGWGGKQRTLFCLSFNMLLMLRYGLFPWLLTRSWCYATVDSAWVHMKNNIPASLSSKSPLIETSIRAWQWRFTRYHIPAFGCRKRTQFNSSSGEGKKCARIQNWGKIAFYKMVRFSDHPKHEKMQFYLRKHRHNPKHTVITCVLCLPRCQKHCKHHVSQSWWIPKIATTTRSVSDPAGRLCLPNAQVAACSARRNMA